MTKLSRKIIVETWRGLDCSHPHALSPMASVTRYRTATCCWLLTVTTAYVFAADRGLLWNSRCLLARFEKKSRTPGCVEQGKQEDHGVGLELGEHRALSLSLSSTYCLQQFGLGEIDKGNTSCALTLFSRAEKMLTENPS